MEINKYLEKPFYCRCGRVHGVNMDRVVIGENTLGLLPAIIDGYGYRTIYMIADTNTHKACGRMVLELLQGKNLMVYSHIYKTPLVPDERALDEFMSDLKPSTDLIIAVGAGTINDMCKYLSHKLSIPYFIVATAPSMDGYASDGAALILNNLKVTLPATLPNVILADTGVLAKAPYEMISSGYGDMVGKFSALNDWKLSSIINDEYYCDFIVNMVEDSLRECLNHGADLKNRSLKALEVLMESLVLTGIAMSFAGNSRPASGSEHHLSHYMELICLNSNRQCPGHGTKVGINTIITGNLREFILNSPVDFSLLKDRSIDEGMKKESIFRVFGPSAKSIIEQMETEPVNEPSVRLKRLQRIEARYSSLRTVLGEVPGEDEIIGFLERAGCSTKYQSGLFSRTEKRDGILYAKEIRRRYTVLQLAEDLGLLEPFSKINF